jgi:hypothetical protein
MGGVSFESFNAMHQFVDPRCGDKVDAANDQAKPPELIEDDTVLSQRTRFFTMSTTA